MSGGGAERRVGREDREHRRHVRLDHARALAEASHVDGDGRAVSLRDLALEGDLLRVGVGRHDGKRRLVGRLGRVPETRHGRGNALLVWCERQLHADDSRRGDENVLGVAAERLRDEGRGATGVLQTGLAGARVGIARVEDHRPGMAAGGAGAGENHGGGAELVGGEGPGADADVIGRDEGEITAAGLMTEARDHARGAHARGGAHASLARDESVSRAGVVRRWDDKGLVVLHGRTLHAGMWRMPLSAVLAPGRGAIPLTG